MARGHVPCPWCDPDGAARARKQPPTGEVRAGAPRPTKGFRRPHPRAPKQGGQNAPSAHGGVMAGGRSPERRRTRAGHDRPHALGPSQVSLRKRATRGDDSLLAAGPDQPTRHRTASRKIPHARGLSQHHGFPGAEIDGPRALLKGNSDENSGPGPTEPTVERPLPQPVACLRSAPGGVGGHRWGAPSGLARPAPHRSQPDACRGSALDRRGSAIGAHQPQRHRAGLCPSAE